MLNNRDFGAKIADLRKKKGLTQAQLADMLNISNKTISRWETGEGYPEVTLLSRLAKALGVTVDELLAEPEQEAEAVQEQPDRFESFEQVSDTENKKSKVKKHKDIPVEWPQIQLSGFFKRPTVIINILQIIFFIIFSALAIEFENQITYKFIMILVFILMISLCVLICKSQMVSKRLTLRNIVISAIFASGILLSFVFFKSNRQLIYGLFWGVMLIYLVLEIIRINGIRHEQKICSDIPESNNTFWKSLTIFNKMGLICMMVCVAAPFISILITQITQSFIVPVTNSAVAVTPAIMLTFITILPKIGLIVAAVGLILGACDLYDRQYKTSIIIIGANLILPYLISFLSVILFIYPYHYLSLSDFV